MDTSSSVVKTMAELPSLVDNLLLLLSEKEKNVISKRFSLEGNRRHTLEEIGQEFSVTRERVRQIEKNALSKMKRNVFNTALKNLHDFSTTVLRQHGGLVREDVLIDEIKAVLPSDFRVDAGAMHLAIVLHDELECVGNTITFFPYLRDTKISDYSLKYASNQLVNQMRKYGNTKSIEKVHRDMTDVFSELGFDVSKIKSLVDIDKRLTMVDDDLVALLEWRHINPRTLRDKILYILRASKKPMHFSEIAEKISAEDFDVRKVNIQAVHNELIRHEQFVLIGRGIYALADWGYESGTVADVIQKILSDGNEMSQDQIVDEVLKRRQVKKITIVLALKNHDKFERIGRKMYKLKA